MKVSRIRAVGCTSTMLFAIAACGGDPAHTIASQSPNPQQESLWRDVATEGSPPGVQNLPPGGATPRQPALPPPSPTVPVAPGYGLAPSIATGIELLNAPAAELQYAGNAVVIKTSGDQIVLDIGANRIVVVAARYMGAPLGVAAKENVTVDVQLRPGPDDFQEIVALRTSKGVEVISARESSLKPIALAVGLPPMLKLTATQVGVPANGTMSVAVVVNGAKEVLNAGAQQQVGVNVNLLVSLAEPTAAGPESPPYAVNLKAWRP